MLVTEMHVYRDDFVQGSNVLDPREPRTSNPYGSLLMRLQLESDTAITSHLQNSESFLAGWWFLTNQT